MIVQQLLQTDNQSWVWARLTKFHPGRLKLFTATKEWKWDARTKEERRKKLKYSPTVTDTPLQCIIQRDNRQKTTVQNEAQSTLESCPCLLKREINSMMGGGRQPQTTTTIHSQLSISKDDMCLICTAMWPTMIQSVAPPSSSRLYFFFGFFAAFFLPFSV